MLLDLLVEEKEIYAENNEHRAEKDLKDLCRNFCGEIDRYGNRDQRRRKHRYRGLVGDVLAVLDRIIRCGAAGKEAGDGCRRGVRGQKMRQKHHREDAKPESADSLNESRAEADEDYKNVV